MQSITTQPFRGTPSGYVRRVAAMWLSKWWWAISLPLLICLILAINEAMWLFVALMLIFLLYPGLVMFVYINHAFSPEAQRTLYEQTVTISDSGIQINYIDKNNSVRYDVNDIVGVEFNANHTVVKFRKPRYYHIAIPMSAVDEASQPQMLELLNALSPLSDNYDSTGN